VIIRDLDFVGISILPSETDPILVVDPDAVLLAPIAVKPLKMISRRNGKVQKVPNVIDLVELSSGNAPEVSWTGSPGSGGIEAIEDVLGSTVLE
jgi:hypothetical protein